MLCWHVSENFGQLLLDHVDHMGKSHPLNLRFDHSAWHLYVSSGIDFEGSWLELKQYDMICITQYPRTITVVSLVCIMACFYMESAHNHLSFLSNWSLSWSWLTLICYSWGLVAFEYVVPFHFLGQIETCHINAVNTSERECLNLVHVL